MSPVQWDQAYVLHRSSNPLQMPLLWLQRMFTELKVPLQLTTFPQPPHNWVSAKMLSSLSPSLSYIPDTLKHKCDCTVWMGKAMLPAYWEVPHLFTNCKTSSGIWEKKWHQLRASGVVTCNYSYLLTKAVNQTENVLGFGIKRLHGGLSIWRHKGMVCRMMVPLQL